MDLKYCTSQPVKPKYCCKLCKMILDGPEQCDSCDAAYCKSCIAVGTQTDKNCPACSEVYQGQVFNRQKYEELLKLKFKWPENEKVFDYNAAFDYGKRLNATIKCPLGCQKTGGQVEEF